MHFGIGHLDAAVDAIFRIGWIRQRLAEMLHGLQFHVAYARAHEERKKAPAGNLFSLVAAFKSSTEYTSLADKTRKDYLRYLKAIEEEFGTMPLSVVQDRRDSADRGHHRPFPARRR